MDQRTSRELVEVVLAEPVHWNLVVLELERRAPDAEAARAART